MIEWIKFIKEKIYQLWKYLTKKPILEEKKKQIKILERKIKQADIKEKNQKNYFYDIIK